MDVSLVRRTYAGAMSVLAVIGLATLLGLTWVPFEGDGAKALPLRHEPFFEPAKALSTAIEGPVETGLEREQRAITDFIAKRYRVSDTAIAAYVASAYRAGEEYSVDPLLILAIMAIESRYNPVAESTVGAKGLMQVLPKYHLDKLLDHGGEDALLEPEVNIQVGAQILREYQRRFRDTETALQVYAGAFDEPSGAYSAKVFAERARLELLRQRARKAQTA
jgi:soluble lytic murein transglycosylase-like protein